MHITDPILLQERDELGMKYKVDDNTSSAGDIFLSFLVKVIQIGVSCSVESPKERKQISDVVGELNSLRKLFLEQAYWKEKTRKTKLIPMFCQMSAETQITALSTDSSQLTQECTSRESNPGLYHGRVLFYH
ncbi:hypothetical protein H5410_016038 [Solanum commersonii]|uniref:Uncharacterized protein n=1 Tax=Solanum commersonii TaxID=4109 RepID=A0A9J5ZVC2_SOLCO|nr:hypothetical protein H5410_016038 [Solanum commersonii]